MWYCVTHTDFIHEKPTCSTNHSTSHKTMKHKYPQFMAPIHVLVGWGRWLAINPVSCILARTPHWLSSTGRFCLLLLGTLELYWLLQFSNRWRKRRFLIKIYQSLEKTNKQTNTTTTATNQGPGRGRWGFSFSNFGVHFSTETGVFSVKTLACILDITGV